MSLSGCKNILTFFCDWLIKQRDGDETCKIVEIVEKLLSLLSLLPRQIVVTLTLYLIGFFFLALYVTHLIFRNEQEKRVRRACKGKIQLESS